MTEATAKHGQLAYIFMDNRDGTFIYRSEEINEPKAFPIARVYSDVYVKEILTAVNTAPAMAKALDNLLNLMKSKTGHGDDTRTILSQLFSRGIEDAKLIGAFVAARDVAREALAAWDAGAHLGDEWQI